MCRRDILGTGVHQVWTVMGTAHVAGVAGMESDDIDMKVGQR